MTKMLKRSTDKELERCEQDMMYIISFCRPLTENNFLQKLRNDIIAQKVDIIVNEMRWLMSPDNCMYYD